MLQVILQAIIKTAEEKSEIIRKKFDIEVSVEMKEVLRTVCNLSEGIYERGMAHGIVQGEENKTVEMKKEPLEKRHGC
ncbi:hypothetical protein SAMN05216582_11764 [Selenomonas ruminantium]|uniref:Uncharacterized protein n=1 Tax=Selenomonas ruminantium TaxID=971 RepID=A0A1M6VAM0_SELRU|nr:hypothetical protein [Selenomonas ruminantium]SHK78530.1 hypothetical protein SAMN05216582_11764 [Selenomonas ruminantium]